MSTSGWGITADVLKFDQQVWCNKCGYAGSLAGHNARRCSYEPVPETQRVAWLRGDLDVCVCGHPRHDHNGKPGRGPCMTSTALRTWACECNEFSLGQVSNHTDPTE